MDGIPGRTNWVQPLQPQCLRCDYGDLFLLRVEKGDQAFCLGEYDLAAQIFHLVLPRLPRLPQPDRDLCLRLGNALARAGHVFEALGVFRGAAWLKALRPEELGHLACGIASVIRVNEWHLQALTPESDLEMLYWGRPPTVPSPPASATLRDLFGCPRCTRLLFKPVTLPRGVTVCMRCVGKCESRSQAVRVNVVLNNLLKKWFPDEGRVRSLVTKARTLQRRQQHEAALVRCEQALDLVPGDKSLLLLRAELYLNMKKYEQAFQDASDVCQNDPFFVKGHHIQAQALCGLGRTQEMLKEFLYCLALNPEFTSVRKDAQKVLCKLLFHNFGNMPQNSTPSIQSGTVNTRSTLQSNRHADAQSSLGEGCDAGPSTVPSENPYVSENTNSSLFYFMMSQQCEEDNKTVEDILSIKPHSGVKRRCPNDLKSVSNVNIPGKIPKKNAASSPESNISESKESDIVKDLRFLIDASDFDCSLCMRLLLDPVTTPCGHMFCLKCLDMSLYHAAHCPLCREALPELLESRNFKITTLAKELILRCLPDESSERKRIHDEEMLELTNLTTNVPIFASAVAFPTVSCLLQVVEPQYQLVINRCMENGSKRFGLCLPNETAGISEYGCLMEIVRINTFSNGRKIVEAIGIRRFRVSHHRYRNGLNTVDVEYLEDEKVEEGPEYEELTNLHDLVYQQSLSWLDALPEPMKTHVLDNFGLIPEKDPEPQSGPDGPAWSWWVLAVLPLEQEAQLAILAKTSLKERLLDIQRVVVQVTYQMNTPEELSDSSNSNN